MSQLIPGHEVIGTIVEMGKNVKGFSTGDRCVADVGITVRRGSTVYSIVHKILVRQLLLLSPRPVIVM